VTDKKSKDGLEKLLQLYLQAKISGNFKLVQFYGAMILKLGGKLPK
jgi:hypothetical protein